MDIKNNEQLKALVSGEIKTFILGPSFFYSIGKENGMGLRFPYLLEVGDVVDVFFTAQINKQSSPRISYSFRIVYGGVTNSMTIPVATSDGIMPVQVDYASDSLQFCNLLAGTGDNIYTLGDIVMTYHKDCTKISYPSN